MSTTPAEKSLEQQNPMFARRSLGYYVGCLFLGALAARLLSYAFSANDHAPGAGVAETSTTRTLPVGSLGDEPDPVLQQRDDVTSIRPGLHDIVFDGHILTDFEQACAWQCSGSASGPTVEPVRYVDQNGIDECLCRPAGD